MRVVILAAIIFILSVTTSANQIVSSDGISMEFPDEWTVLDKEQRQQIALEAKGFHESLSDIDSNKYVIYVKNFSDGDDYESVNVIASKGNFDLDKYEAGKFADDILASFEKMGIDVRLIESRKKTFDGCKAFVIKYYLNSESFDVPRINYQAYIEGCKRMYTITYSGAELNISLRDELFNNIMNSVTVVYGSPRFWYELPPILRGAIQGAIIGIIVGAVSYYVRRRKSVKPKNDTVN